MPKTHLWAVTNQGRVYVLSTCGQKWKELSCSSMEFKRVAAVESCGWAIGGDHQIYVYTFATDVPIRVKEVAYENQRWNPKEGFCTRLLPTDRPLWSTKDGQHERSRGHIKLPGCSWRWETDWQVEYDYDGQVVDPEGWKYAVDFPAGFTREKSWHSFVRRRKWIRIRRFISTNAWANIPCIHEDPIAEPFIDVAVGGQNVPGGSSDSLAIWTVTILGRIMFRKGVNFTCPEGVAWLHVPTPKACEINQLSVGPTGLLWAVTWNGCALVRMGVCRDTLHGSYWLEVPPPNEDSKLFHVSVGTNAVWAITRDSKVWFRRGIKGMVSRVSEEKAVGTAWVEMVGSMALVSVGHNDQVWSLSVDEPKTIFIRTGIVEQDLSGKTWKPILLPCSDDAYSISSRSEEGFRKPAVEEDSIVLGNLTGNYTSDFSMVAPVSTGIDSGVVISETNCKRIPSFDAADLSRPNSGDSDPLESLDLRPKLNEPDEFQQCVTPPLQVKQKSVIRSREGSCSSARESPSRVSTEDTGYFDDGIVEFSWSWISGSGCAVDGLNLPNWFSSGLFGTSLVLNEPWRKDVIDQLLRRNKGDLDRSHVYEEAIEKSSWVVTAKGKVFIEGRQSSWINCKIELEKTTAEDGYDMATFRCFHYGSRANYEKLVFNMNSITCIMCVSDQLKLIFAVYTSSTPLNKTPLRISLQSDTELEDWLALLNNTCCELRGIRGAPSPLAIWTINNRGDIFCNDGLASTFTKTNELYWRQLGGHFRLVETCQAGIVWGLGYDHTPWVYTSGWGGGFYKGMDSSSFGIHPLHDTRILYVYENQRWNPFNGFSNRKLPTDRYAWSDKSGRFECTKDNTKLPSFHWQWIADWTIDFSTPGGVDKDGWQYAKDFPMSYHGQKSLTDYVRRRRWYRKCKLSTYGPWEELDSVPLSDVSIRADISSGSVYLWAVSTKGELLCRIGVTQSCPKGLLWEHVTLDQSAQSVSISSNGGVWVVTKLGNAMLRHGVTKQTPCGSVWFAVEPPAVGCHKPLSLSHISAGTAVVCAIDTVGHLFYRHEVMPILPQGTHWKQIIGDYRCISVGPNDEVWAISGSPASSSGVICRCTNIVTKSEGPVMRLDWDYGIGGNWCFISVRGHSMDHN